MSIRGWITMIWTGVALTFVGLSMLMNRDRVTPEQRAQYQTLLANWRAKFGGEQRPAE